MGMHAHGGLAWCIVWQGMESCGSKHDDGEIRRPDSVVAFRT